MYIYSVYEILRCRIAFAKLTGKKTILGILLRWREEAVPLVGDISKMFHAVKIEEVEQHCHRFSWRDMDTERAPEIYVIQRVSMGDKPAPAIATEALFMTADLYSDSHPRAARFIKESSYVDDLVDSVPTREAAESLAKDTEFVLSEGGFKIKCWQSTQQEGELKGTELKQTSEGQIGVLGVLWDPVRDEISYKAVLNFSNKKHGQRTLPNLTKEEVPKCLPETLTKRLVLQQVMGIYDPLGFIAPATVRGKTLLSSL